MSSKSAHFWSSTILRCRGLLLQILHKKDISSAAAAGCCLPQLPKPPQTSSVAVVPHSFRPFSSTIYVSFLRSYCPRVKVNREKDQASTTPFFFFFPGWAKWIFGSLLSLLIPSWNKLQSLEEEAEMVMEEADKIAEVVEKVADFTEKASAEIAEKLPEKSKLKEAAQVVENYSKQIAHDAHLTQDIIHKVEEWKQKLDKSESAVNGQMDKKEGIADK